ncbi:MAG: hypothetical protein R2708_12665 [Vicinamibacterales bacterium]
MIVVGWISLAACAGAAPAAVSAPSSSAESTVELRVGQTVRPDGAPAAITLDDVHDDSRCPTDATCVWAGDAAVTLRVQPPTGAAERVVLRLNASDARSARAAGLSVRFESLEPSPRTGQSIPVDQYRVRLSLVW